MRLPWRRDQAVARGLAEARRQADEAEKRLAAEREHVVIPLRELRRENHVTEAITMLITQRRTQERPS